MFKSKKEVLASIRSQKNIVNGKEYTVYLAYMGMDDTTGKKIRAARKSREELEKYIDQFFVRMKSGGPALAMLTPFEANDARNAIDLLRQNAIDKTLTDCVREYIGGKGRNLAAKPVALEIALKEYMERGVSELHRKTIESRVGRWIADFGGNRMTDEVTMEEVLGYLKQYDQPRTYNNSLTYIKSFCAWCAKRQRGYMAENPLEEAEQKRVVYTPPEYIKAADVEKVVRELEKGEDKAALAFFVLSFWCGIRREEILRLANDAKAGKIDLANNLVTIIKCKGWERGEPPRSFTPTENALAWMKSFAFKEALAEVGPKSENVFKRAADKVGVKWVKNAGRHTFITMHVAWKQSAAMAATIAGNSEGILKKHYRNIGVPQKEGEYYFRIMPSGKAA